MAVGKPIIASDIHGYNSVLTHGAEGLLVPSKNSKELAKALVDLSDNAPLRQQMGEKGKLTAIKYSWENIAQKVLEQYMRVLG